MSDSPAEFANINKRTQKLRDTGHHVAPISGMPLADLGHPGREAVDAAFWTMIVDTAKAHERDATRADRKRSAASCTAYYQALKEEADAKQAEATVKQIEAQTNISEEAKVASKPKPAAGGSSGLKEEEE